MSAAKKPSLTFGIQLQRDAWRALAEEMVQFLTDGLVETSVPSPRFTRYAAVQADVVESWQRRVAILRGSRTRKSKP